MSVLRCFRNEVGGLFLGSNARSPTLQFMRCRCQRLQFMCGGWGFFSSRLCKAARKDRAISSAWVCVCVCVSVSGNVACPCMSLVTTCYNWFFARPLMETGAKFTKMAAEAIHSRKSSRRWHLDISLRMMKSQHTMVSCHRQSVTVRAPPSERRRQSVAVRPSKRRRQTIEQPRRESHAWEGNVRDSN